MSTIEERWAEYMVSLEGDDSLTPAQRKAFADTWALLVAREPAVMRPTCGVDEEGLYMSWNLADRCMEIQVSRSGERSWFYTEHASRTSPYGDKDDGRLGCSPVARRHVPPGLVRLVDYRDDPSLFETWV